MALALQVEAVPKRLSIGGRPALPFRTGGRGSGRGELGEAFGLVAYPGSGGLASLSLLVRAKRSDTFEAYVRQNCLSLLFASRSELSEKDRAVIRTLGLKFRGKNEWPVLRRQRPDYCPWYLNTFIEQATAFCLEFKDNPHLLNPPRQDLVLVHVYQGE